MAYALCQVSMHGAFYSYVGSVQGWLSGPAGHVFTGPCWWPQPRLPNQSLRNGATYLTSRAPHLGRRLLWHGGG
jgi:hypothetical protein